ncbi:MAG: hypothetical protein ACU83V_05490 [Gammaproteobacteria bacterium]
MRNLMMLTSGAVMAGAVVIGVGKNQFCNVSNIRSCRPAIRLHLDAEKSRYINLLPNASMAEAEFIVQFPFHTAVALLRSVQSMPATHARSNSAAIRPCSALAAAIYA